MKIPAILIAATLCLANNGSCGGGVNSASAANICAAASRAGAAAPLLAQAAVVAGVPANKVDGVLALVMAGKLIVAANCAIVAPAQ